MQNPDPNSARAKHDAFYKLHRDAIGKRVLTEAQFHDPIEVEYRCSDDSLTLILNHIQSVWMKLGREDPHWSVVSAPNYRASNIDQAMSQFRNSGRVEAQNLLRLLKRIDLKPPAGTALEYGCGVGRVSRCLADIFANVIGVDISANHLALANGYFREAGLTNVETIKIDSVEDITKLPAFDFLYSKIVLQHNPPPIIHYVLNALCGKLNSGGMGVIQIPTYCVGYRFLLHEYLENMSSLDAMEMHVLPQHAIFDIFRTHDCHVREVFRDHMITRMDFVSSTIVFCKD
jgi:2-polyprenyl-3-methyl-5-hydroxy-6-metoxy-1,4-benzoquinol methylase